MRSGDVGLIEGILVSALMYGGGYLHRYFNEPKCREIVYEIPDNLKQPITNNFCKRGINPLTGIQETCYVGSETIYERTLESEIRLRGNIIDLQLNLYHCEDVILRYNKNKTYK